MSNESRDHFHDDDDYLVPSPLCGFYFEADFLLSYLCDFPAKKHLPKLKHLEFADLQEKVE